MDIQKIKSQDWVLLIAVVLLVVAFTNFMFVLKDVSDYRKWTGYATDTGKANLTVKSEINIEFFVNNTDWGAGGVNSSYDSATLFTNGTVTNDAGWDPNNQPLVLHNVGNENASIAIRANNTADQFIGGSTGGGPLYQINVSNNESDSCVESIANFSSYQDIEENYNLTCSNLGYASNHNSLNFDIKIRVPSDSPTGTKASIITAEGSSV